MHAATECYAEDTTEFPSNNLFAAAGDGIWDDGAACGRQYLVRCISAPEPLTCANDLDTIQVKIVDYANSAVSNPVVTPATTMLLPNLAFGMLLNQTSSYPSSSSSINIEFQQ
ncbi:putative EG45-like domain containing protein 1 [Bienertia sinuspersici]